MTLRYLPSLLREFFAGKHLGDLAILKATIKKLSPSKDLAPHFHSQRNLCFDFTDIDFSILPKGSFGHEYSIFMEQNRLMPFTFSGKYQHLIQDHCFTVYYAIVHDFFHVLSGFDTSLSGEAGVWGMVAGQGYGKDFVAAWKLTKCLYPIVAPRHTKKIIESANFGYQLGRSAKTVIVMNFREALFLPLEEVRQNLSIVPYR